MARKSAASQLAISFVRLEDELQIYIGHNETMTIVTALEEPSTKFMPFALDTIFPKVLP